MKAVIRNMSDLVHFGQKVVEKLGTDFNGKPYTISIQRLYRPRTTPQNSKYHAMLNDLAMHIGYTPNELKDYFKAEFHPRKSAKIGNRIIDIPMGSSELNTEQMSGMIEQLFQLAAEADYVFENYYETDDSSASSTR